ncbi:signal peptidase I [Flavobacterium haoranii]|uniref:Signal peptidase I n=1 Tax=Flavobacterium haoranii TaxID=683124 RepID=A0A1M6ILZ2_9FLAO|nr:signal peptidase I [Flavobacterium haoranii]SHJ35470.1 signal peptidase I [Flavobacterium haoranii]
METSSWILFILLVQVIHGLGTWKLYIKAGRKAWEAFVPIYNAIVLMKIINRPSWWTFLLFVPIINLFMFPIVWIETLRTFGKKSTLDMILGIVTFGFYIAYVNYTQEVTYFADRDLKAPTKAMDTVGSIAFAIIVATFVHTYFIQPFTIPTSSLEKSLLVGDFLFVSKFHYGARTPMTAVAAPMVHDTLPIVHTKSYTKWPQLPYFRFPGFQQIERNDIVVFNWPVDTVYKFFDRSGRRADKPIDKKSNYVKRCVGVAGDEIQIKEGILYVNGQVLQLPERAKPQFSYKIAIDGKTPINFEYLLKELNITDPAYQVSQDTILFRALPDESVARLKNVPGITNVIRIVSHDVEKGIFPHTKNWNVDNLGPIYIPQEGKTVELNAETLPFYKNIITDYEHNKLEVNGNEIRINGKVVTSYTFKQNYYWMMGDNRHNSEDSRYWGYVPEDHIVGKPIFIWMSIDGINNGLSNWKIRWDRLFTTVSGEGQPKSYFKYFLVLLALYFVGEYFWKKKKKENA